MSPLEKPRKLVDQVLIDLKRKIVEQEFMYGAQLPSEFELMTEYGVGRSTVREAVKILTHAGFLTIRHGQGTFVAYKEADRPQDLSGISGRGHIAETRFILEREIAKLAVERRTAEDLAELRRRLDRRNEALRKGNYSTYLREDLAFHLAVADAAHNESLLAVYKQFSKLLYDHLNQFLLNAPNYNDNTDLHEKIYRAIEEQNGQDAVHWVSANIEANCATGKLPPESAERM